MLVGVPYDVSTASEEGVTRLHRVAERTLAAVFKKSGVKNAHALRFCHALATSISGRWKLQRQSQPVTRKNGPCKLMKTRQIKWCGEGDLNPQCPSRINKLPVFNMTIIPKMPKITGSWPISGRRCFYIT